MTSNTNDVEARGGREPSTLAWRDLEYDVAKGKKILHGLTGYARSGELLAVLGPSGAGKSSFLDVIAQRANASAGTVSFNDVPWPDMKSISAYAEQHDALLGVLTVRETLLFAARLSYPPSTPASTINKRVDDTIIDLGLDRVANSRIGTPIQRGISGGQRRRVTLGCELVRRPQILLLDEPTSGLDSSASRSVISAVRRIARRHGILVIATIHQPSFETLSLFDRVLLLAKGSTAYFGTTTSLPPYLATVHDNPAEHALDLLNDDFRNAEAGSSEHLLEKDAAVDKMITTWSAYAAVHPRGADMVPQEPESMANFEVWDPSAPPSMLFKDRSLMRAVHQTLILCHRTMLLYSRNLLAWGVRLGMYIGMGILLATVWANLGRNTKDTEINDILSVHFFSVAFLGFMSVAGIPAWLEERSVFIRERLNGLYGPGPYVIAISICAAPFLFLCSFVFALVCYWSIGLHPGAGHFFRFLGILFLAVYTAESQSLVVAALLPIFVAALAIASFLNGFWMCVQGYFIRAVNLPTFWRVWAHWIDYQTFAFNSLVNNDFRGLVFKCTTVGSECHCAYPSSLVASGQCAVSGEDVLGALDIGGISIPLYVSILLLIALVFRVALYVILVFKKR
ncbi:P-loop containing nucleoside triphosphate hydrolase protein [Auriculariales sp. MPI-PUGE-AT-0066]|nr:P-loop containing nucleoside triphosphate hydrolase protein [Auriculariales sp. MPI-PUGE-AT-0066]